MGAPFRTGLPQQVTAIALDPRDGSLWLTTRANGIRRVRVDTPCGVPAAGSSSTADGPAASSQRPGTPRRAYPVASTCVDPKRNIDVLPAAVAHEPGYMNTQIPRTYGENRSCEELNLDAVVMAGHTCHRCLPEPCLHGGQCQGVQGRGFTCNCSGAGAADDDARGREGDLCQKAISRVVPAVPGTDATVGNDEVASLSGLSPLAPSATAVAQVVIVVLVVWWSS